MSEAIVVALVTSAGALLGAIITSVATIVAARSKENRTTISNYETEKSKSGNKNSMWSLILFVTLGAIIGLVLGILITTRTQPINSIVGEWSGTWSAQVLGKDTSPIKITIQEPCNIGYACGILELPDMPCSFDLILESAKPTGFSFSRSVRTGVCSDSTEKDTLQAPSDGTLVWITSTGKASGILRKIK
jgi:hypothetical protein